MQQEERISRRAAPDVRRFHRGGRGCRSVRASVPPDMCAMAAKEGGPCFMLRFARSQHRASIQVALCCPRLQQVFVSMTFVRVCLLFASVSVVRRLSSRRSVLHAPTAQNKVFSGLADPLPLARAMPLLRRFSLRGDVAEGWIPGACAGVIMLIFAILGFWFVPAKPGQSSVCTRVLWTLGAAVPKSGVFD